MKPLFPVAFVPCELALRLPKPFFVLRHTTAFISWKWHLVLASLCCDDRSWQGFSRQGELSWLQAKSQLLNFMLVNSCFSLHRHTNVPYKYSPGALHTTTLPLSYSSIQSKQKQMLSVKVKTCFFQISRVKRPPSHLIQEENILFSFNK